MIKTFQDLDAYKRVKVLFGELVTTVNKFPPRYHFLLSQLLRAANSVSSNIAEGFGRSEAEFKKYLTSSLGSNNEIISHLENALTVKCINQDIYDDLVVKYTVLGKQIYQLREKWKNF